jgi:hypothetical protein
MHFIQPSVFLVKPFSNELVVLVPTPTKFDAINNKMPMVETIEDEG